MSRHAAIDLGASSGRVVVAEVTGERLDLTELSRFPNAPVHLTDGLHWDALGLHRAALEGLRLAGDADTIGVDSWAVDYGLLNATGELIADPYNYRDSRTNAAVGKVHRRLPFAELYRHNGLQFLPFTTLYQLAVDTNLDDADTLLLIPDLVGYWLTGTLGAEATNASTTGLLDVHTRQWSLPVLDAIDLCPSMLPPLRQPGDVLGLLLPAAQAVTGFNSTVFAVGSHDTASAVAGVPMQDGEAAYISLGTWGLVGVELERPVLTAASREANFTNELGVDGRVRYLRNVMGLWLLQESLRAWGDQNLQALLGAAATLPRGVVFDVNDPRLLPPGDLPGRIRALVTETGGQPPLAPVHLVRAVLDSLASALAETVRDAARLSGQRLAVVHVVGGGAQNALLCQLVADACNLPVIAGPVEATAIGNVLIQARAYGTLSGDLESLRSLVSRTQTLRRFEPRP